MHGGDPMIHGQNEMGARLMEAEVVAAATDVRSVEEAHVVARPGGATVDGEKYLNTVCGQEASPLVGGPRGCEISVRAPIDGRRVNIDAVGVHLSENRRDWNFFW